MKPDFQNVGNGSDFAVRHSQANGLVGWKADRRLRMRNVEWLTLTLIEATLVEATLVRITHRLRRFANMR